MWLRTCTLKLAAVIVILAAVAAACGPPDGEAGTATTLGPHDAAAEVRADLITLESSRALAGEQISVFFPDERTRGVLYVLEAQTADGWNHEYYLVSDWGGTRAPTNHKANAMGFAIEDIGIAGPGPDVVLIPNEATPGEYRICTGNSRPNICARLAIDAGA